jgi:RNA polymerase sigma-70 factor (ECF subfamily)
MPSASSPLHRDISALYAGHHSWLQGWLRRKLGNACDAADLAQDTFVRLLAAPAGDLPALREPRAYLATVARRLLINHLRRQSLEQAWLQALAALPEPQAPSPEQQLLILSQVEGLTYAAIAEQLGMGLRSVKRYMAQAMAECILLSA